MLQTHFVGKGGIASVMYGIDDGVQHSETLFFGLHPSSIFNDGLKMKSVSENKLLC
jgi:hypothetical protein